MSNESHVTIEFRRYLLGELPEPARTAFEEAYFSNPELMEEIWAAETDLVDAYVTDRLDGDERRLFESRYLTSPQRRERVAVARALQSRIRAAGIAPVMVDTAPAAAASAPVAPVRAEQDAPAPPAPVPFRRRVEASGVVVSGPVKQAAKPPRFTTWQLAAAAALVLAAATIAWLMMQGGSVNLPPPSSASSNPAPPSTAPEPTPKPPEAVPPGTATPNNTPPGTVASNPPSPAPTTPPGGTRSPLTVLAVTLSPIQLRSDAGQTSVTVPANTDRIALRFEGDRGDAREVALDIRTVEGKRVWTGGVRIERPTPAGVAATVSVPAKSLPPDDYIATLFAVTPGSERTELNRYVFRIARP